MVLAGVVQVVEAFCGLKAHKLHSGSDHIPRLLVQFLVGADA